MSNNTNRVKDIYEGKVARHYDMSMNHFFNKVKEKAFSHSSLKSGDTVLVFCCGTGLDFPHILRRIVQGGKIIGVDFSREMLDQAQRKISRNGWSNIELVHADVTTFHKMLTPKADAGVCTLGMSIIPDFKAAYHNLISNIKEEGEIIIGDMQLASGWEASLNPLTISLARRYGGTEEGHQNSLELNKLIKETLVDVRRQEFFFKSYYFCVGRTRKMLISDVS